MTDVKTDAMTDLTTPPTLLERANGVQLKRRGGKAVSNEEIELAVAWHRGQISITQVAGALGVKTGGVYPFLAQAMSAYAKKLEEKVYG